MAKRIVTNQKTGQQGVFDDSTGEVTPLSGTQKIVTHKSGVKGIFDERSGEVTPLDGLTDLPQPTAPTEEPKKKDVTVSAGANPLLGGKVITGFGSLNTGETGAEKAIGKFAVGMATHPVDTVKGMGKGAWDFAVDAFSGLSKFVQAGGSAGSGAPSQFISAQEKGILDTGEKSYKQRLETAEQLQKGGLDKLRFATPEGKSPEILTYDKKSKEMGMRAPDAEAFGYEAGKGIAQMATMAFGGVMGMGASFFSSLENNFNDARKQGIPADRAFAESAVRAGAETASDKFLGISNMIEKAMAKGVSKAAVNQLLTGEISKEAFGKLVAGQGKNIGKGFIAEFGEEFSQEYMDEGIKTLFNYYQTKKKEDDPSAKVEMYETKDLLSKEMLTGALNSGIYGGIIGSMGGAFLNSRDYHPTVYSSLQNAYDDSGTEGLARAKANIIKGIDKAITDKKYGAEQRETALANLDLMEKNINSFQQKSGVDELTRYQKFDLENYSIPNNTAELSTYLSSSINNDIIPNQGDIDKDIEDGLVEEIPFNNIINVPDAFLPYVEKSKVFQGEGDNSVVARVPNTVKAAFEQNKQTKSEFAQAVNNAMNTVLGGSTNASYESILYAGRQLFEDKTKQDAFEMELAQHEPAIKKRIQWSNYLHGLKKSVEKTGKPFDIAERNQALKNINTFSEGDRVIHNGVDNTIESLSPDGQKARMANFEGEVSLSELQTIEAPTEMPAPAATEGEVQAEAAPVTEATPNKISTDISLTPIASVANDGKAYEYQGQIGMFSQDNQGRVTFESPSKIYDLGNANDPDFNQKTLGSFGIQVPPSNVTVNDNGTVEIDGKKYTNKATNPVKAITYDENGQAVSIRLYNEKGEVRTIRGIRAQTIDYKYKLKDFGNTATDTEIQSAIDEATEIVDTQQSTGETNIATEDKPVEQAQQVEELPSSDRVETLVEKIKSSTGKMITAIDAAINSATNALRETGITVEMFETTAEFNKAVGITGNKIPQGIFLSETGKIFLNREAMQAGWETTVVWHEATHPIINIIRNTDRKLYDSVVSGVLKLAESNPQFKAVSDFVNSEYSSEESIPDEILVEAIARIASGKIVFNTVPTTLREKLVDLVNKMAKALGMKDNLVSVSNEKAFKDLAGKIVETLKQGEGISKVVGLDNVGNFQLDSPSGFVDENGKDLTNRQMQFRLQNNYTDPASGITFSYLKDSADFEQLKKDGYITENKTLADFNGSHIFLHQPDAAFTGMIMKNGQLLVKGNGGIFYPINFHKDGYFWASTSTAANAMAAQLNQNAKLNKGKILMALTSAPSDKLLSSTTSSSAVLDLFVSKTFDDTFGLKENDVKAAIHKALEQELVQKILIKDKDGNPILKDKKKQYVTKRFFLNSNGVKLSEVIPANDNIQNMVSVIKLALAPDKSSFKERKFFAEQLMGKIADMVKGTPAEQKLGEFFHIGIGNETFKGAQAKKYKISAANLKQAISYMLSEPLLRQTVLKGQKEDKGGRVYAILEMEVKGDGDAVKSVESSHHESYPMTVAKMDANSKIRLHILQDRQMWSDHFQDFKTGKIVKSGRLKKVYPTSGVSVQSLKLDFQKGQMSQGNREHSYENTLYDADLTDKEIQDWKKENRLKKEKATVPSVMEAAEKLYQGEITYDEYLKTVREDQPIIPFKEVPELPTIKEVIGSLDSNKLEKGILNLNDNIQDGQYVSSRLDIPAYQGYGVYVVTVHDTAAGSKPLAYGQTAVLQNVTFNASPQGALYIAKGTNKKGERQDKFPFAKIFGNWVNEDPETAHARAEQVMKDPNWIQVGMNPARHSFFYNKADGMPIVSADEVIQVGALVLARNPVMTTPYDAMFTAKNAKGEPVQFSQGDRLSQADEFVKENKDNYTPEELSAAIQQGFGYAKDRADAIVSNALRNPSSPSLTMVYDSKMVDESAPMNQSLELENDIIQGSREAVDKHLQEQEQKDRVTIAGLMEALVDDKWDIRKAIEKYSGKKGFATALLRTISGINAAIDLKLKRSMDEIYNGLNEVGEENLDRLIFSYRVIQLFEKQNKKRDRYYKESLKKAIDDYFKENKRVPSTEEMYSLTDKFKKEARDKYPDMASGVTTWNGKPDTVVTVDMAYETVANMEKKLGTVVEVGGFKDLERRAMAYKRFANESLKEAHRAGMISDEVYEDYKDDFYSYRITVDRLFESMSNEDQQMNRRTMEKAFGSLSKSGTQNAIMTNSRISMGLSYVMMHKAIKRNELKKSIYEDTVAKGLGGDLFKPANFLISKKTGEILTDEKGDQVGSADSGFTHIGIKIDGRNTYYQMKTSLFNQMEGLNKTFENPSVSEKFLQGLGNVSNRTLTAFATRYNPLFFDSNIPMDLGQQIIFTDIWDKGKTYTNLIGSSFRAIARTAQFVDPLGRNKEKVQSVLEDWIEYGGSMDLMSLSKEMKTEFTSEGSVTLHGDPKKKTFTRKFKDGISYFNAKTEVAMRLAAFNEVRNNMLEDYVKENNNKKPSENEMYKINTIAAAQSRAYTDFAQKGTYLPKWNMPYLNSSVQAFAATLEYASSNPKAIAFKFAQMGSAGFAYQLGIMSAMALFGAGGMDDVTEYEKDRNILIPLFYTVGKDKFGNPKNIWHFKKIRVNPSIVPFWIATRKSAELAFNSINGIEKKPLTAGEIADGTIDAMNEALPLAIPMVGFSEPKFTQRIGQVLSRKLLMSAMYKGIFGVDTYRDRDLRSYDDIQGILSAEGIDNKNVPYIYKFLGKTIGVSPIRTQAVAETFITSASTNIITGLAYSASSDLANAIIPAGTETERGEYRFFDKGGVPNLDKIGTALGKKSFTKSNPDLEYNTEMNEKYKMQSQLLKEANTKDRLMKIDLEEIKSQTNNSDEFFQKAINEYIPRVEAEGNIEKTMSAYKMIEQIMMKGVKKDIFSEKSYTDAIILKNSGDATGRAKMMQYMYGDNLETAQEMINYSSTLGLPAEEVYFALEEYKKLIKK